MLEILDATLPSEATLHALKMPSYQDIFPGPWSLGLPLGPWPWGLGPWALALGGPGPWALALPLALGPGPGTWALGPGPLAQPAAKQPSRSQPAAKQPSWCQDAKISSLASRARGILSNSLGSPCLPFFQHFRKKSGICSKNAVTQSAESLMGVWGPLSKKRAHRSSDSPPPGP